MKKVFVVLLAMALPTGVMAADSVTQIGSISHPDGSVTAVYEARTDRLMHHEQAKLLAYRTESVKGANGKYAPRTKLESDPVAVGGMAWLGQGAAGFIGNLPTVGGLIGGAALLRPSSVNQTGGGAGSAVGDGATGGANTGAGSGVGGLTINNSASASAKASARQSQIQSQTQIQSQSQMQSQINKGGKTIIHHNNGLHLGEGHGTGNPH